MRLRRYDVRVVGKKSQALLDEAFLYHEEMVNLTPVGRIVAVLSCDFEVAIDSLSEVWDINALSQMQRFGQLVHTSLYPRDGGFDLFSRISLLIWYHSR